MKMRVRHVRLANTGLGSMQYDCSDTRGSFDPRRQPGKIHRPVTLSLPGAQLISNVGLSNGLRTFTQPQNCRSTLLVWRSNTLRPTISMTDRKKLISSMKCSTASRATAVAATDDRKLTELLCGL